MSYTSKNPVLTGVTFTADANQTQLLYFTEDTFTATFTQAGGFSQAVTVKATRIGKQVWLEIPTFTGTATSNNYLDSGATDIPTRFRPAATKCIYYASIVNGATATGQIVFNSSGSIEIQASATGNTFTSGQQATFLNAGQASTFSFKTS